MLLSRCSLFRESPSLTPRLASVLYLMLSSVRYALMSSTSVYFISEIFNLRMAAALSPVPSNLADSRLKICLDVLAFEFLICSFSPLLTLRVMKLPIARSSVRLMLASQSTLSSFMGRNLESSIVCVRSTTHSIQLVPSSRSVCMLFLWSLMFRALDIG